MYLWKKGALHLCNYSKSDQDNLQQKISKDWDREGQMFCFEPSGGDRRFMFVHQTREQKRLMEVYGGKLCLLDATHRTTKYALYLFFIVVKTNVDYQVYLIDPPLFSSHCRVGFVLCGC